MTIPAPPKPESVHAAMLADAPQYGHVSFETAYTNHFHPWREGRTTVCKHWVETKGFNQVYRERKLRPNSGEWTDSPLRVQSGSVILLMRDTAGMIYPWCFNFATMASDEILSLLTWPVQWDAVQRNLIQPTPKCVQVTPTNTNKLIDIARALSTVYLRKGTPSFSAKQLIQLTDLAYNHPELLPGRLRNRPFLLNNVNGLSAYAVENDINSPMGRQPLRDWEIVKNTVWRAEETKRRQITLNHI